jgi:hypothetical protein
MMLIYAKPPTLPIIHHPVLHREPDKKALHQEQGYILAIDTFGSSFCGIHILDKSGCKCA